MSPSTPVGSANVAGLPGHLRVHVPATSANVGVGFDCLGLALSLANEFSFRPADRFSATGCDERFRGEDNLVWTTYREVLAHLGLEGEPFALAIETRIPLSGGLGSSSTCVVAGVIAALVAAGVRPSAEEVLAHAVPIEGHPDNVVPAVMGGLISAFVTDEGELVTVQTPVDGRWRFCTLCPPYEVRTEDARRVLPDAVDRSTAIWQMGRCLCLPKAFEAGDGALLGKVLDDRLHEPHRRLLIPDYEEARAVALDAGANGFWISGSGSTLIAACLGDDAARRVMDAWGGVFPDYRSFLLEADTRGATFKTQA